MYDAKITSEASVSRKWLSRVIVDDVSQDIATSHKSISIVDRFIFGKLIRDAGEGWPRAGRYGQHLAVDLQTGGECVLVW